MSGVGFQLSNGEGGVDPEQVASSTPANAQRKQLLRVGLRTFLRVTVEGWRISEEFGGGGEMVCTRDSNSQQTISMVSFYYLSHLSFFSYGFNNNSFLKAATSFLETEPNVRQSSKMYESNETRSSIICYDKVQNKTAKVIGAPINKPRGFT